MAEASGRRLRAPRFSGEDPDVGYAEPRWERPTSPRYGWRDSAYGMVVRVTFEA